MTLILAPRPRLLTAAVLFCFGLRLSAAPTVTQQPTDVAVTSGQNATFTVGATGSGPLAFQWRRSGFAIPGATAATFVQGRVTLGETGFYDVLVADGTGTTRSSVAELTVAPRLYPAMLAPASAYSLPLTRDWFNGVRRLARSPDGGYYAAGYFGEADGQPRTFVLHMTAAGELDPNFVPPQITGQVAFAVAVQPDGKVLLGGTFNHVGNFAREGLVRLNPDGSFDSSFKPALPSMGYVSAIVVQDNGQILVAHWPSPAVLRLNADGSLDATLGVSISGTINAMVVQSDGKIVAVGPISALINGQTFSAAIRINPDGIVDSSFRASYGGALQAVALAGDGSVYVAGAPTYGSGGPAVLHLTAAGTPDPAFAPTFDSAVNALLLQTDGKIIVGGGFSRVDGVYHPQLARLHPDGTLDVFAETSPQTTVQWILQLPDNSIVVAGDSSGTLQQGPAHYLADGSLAASGRLQLHGVGYISELARLPSGKFMAFGTFDYAGGASTRNLLRLNADGTPDPTFANASTDVANGMMRGLALPDGRIAVGGRFANFMGHPNLGVALLKADGSPDYSFSQASSLLISGNAIGLSPDGKIVAGGDVIGGSSTGAVFEYNLDGTLVGSFASAAQFNASVTDLVVQRDGGVVAVGYFSTFNGAPTGALVRLKPDGTLDSAFGAAAHFTIAYCVRLAASGQIYVSGMRSTASGTTLGVFRLNPDGTTDPTFQPQINGSVYAILLQPDGKAIVRVTPPGQQAPYTTRLNADGSVDPTFQAIGVDPVLRADGWIALLRDDGQLFYAEGEQQADRLQITTFAGPPVITAFPTAATLPVGGTTTLHVVASSALPLTYQWQYNGAPIAGATDATYTVANFNAANAGNYAVVVSNQLGSATTGPVAVTAPLDSSGHLVNLSIRATAGDTNPLVLGVVLGGAATGGNKPLLFRAAGPTLTYFNVAGALVDPVLELYDGTGFKIDQNDDWAGVFDFTSVGAFPFRGTAPKDAAIYNPYATNGAQTIHILGKPGSSGVVLGEVYDATPGGAFTVTTPRIINGSARTAVGTGDNALILGFGVAGQGSVRVLIRAIGPTLAAAPFDLGGMLADPTLEIRGGDNSVVATNDNWSDNGAAATMTAAFDSVGAFHLGAGSKDSAAIVTLAPGTYSAVIRGTNATTGTAMAELYVLP